VLVEDKRGVPDAGKNEEVVVKKGQKNRKEEERKQQVEEIKRRAPVRWSG